MKSTFVAAAMALLIAAPATAQGTFPYDQEMLLEAKPMPGSRRVPMMEVQSGGRATVDLWCHSAAAEVTVSGSEIKINFVSAQEQGCTPERGELDEALGKGLSEVTSWSQQNDIVILSSPTATFRFRISTH